MSVEDYAPGRPFLETDIVKEELGQFGTAQIWAGPASVIPS